MYKKICCDHLSHKVFVFAPIIKAMAGFNEAGHKPLFHRFTMRFFGAQRLSAEEYGILEGCNFFKAPTPNVAVLTVVYVLVESRIVFEVIYIDVAV